MIDVVAVSPIGHTIFCAFLRLFAAKPPNRPGLRALRALRGKIFRPESGRQPRAFVDPEVEIHALNR